MTGTGAFTATHFNMSIEITDVVTIHYIKYSKDFAFTGEKHDFWEMVFVDKGEAGVLAENQGFDLREGEAIFHKPGEYHNIWAKGKFANVAILSFVCESPDMAFFENKIIAFGEEGRDLLAKILAAARQCVKGPLDDIYQTKIEFIEEPAFASGQVIKNYMELLLIALVQKQTDAPREGRRSLSAKKQGENTIVEAIRQMLAENVYGSITLDDILARICFSKSYLTRLFRAYTGESIMEHYTNMKLDEAKRLISERRLSFSEIADKLMFGSIHYFSHTFKKKTRMSPSEYRRSVEARGFL